jgi:ABC-type nitrate/sulfonate/bicarbonate transport system substrate-binding protein
LSTSFVCRVLQHLGAALLISLPTAVLAADSLRMAVSKSPLSLPIFVALEQGFFTEQGIDAQVIDCVGGVSCMRELLDGRADVATASEMAVAFGAFHRSDYAIVSTIATSSSNLKLVAGARAGTLATPRDWAGKRVGTSLGSASHYFLELHLLALNVDPRGLTIIDLAPDKSVGALQSGHVDAVAVWEPFGYLAAKAPGATGRVLPRASAYMQTFNLVAARRLFGVRDDALVRMLRAVERGQQFIQDKPEEAKAILRKRLALDESFVTWFWPTTNFRLGLDPALLRTMESEARWAVREGQVPNKASPNFMGFVYPGPLMSAKPAAVSVGR